MTMQNPSNPIATATPAAKVVPVSTPAEARKLGENLIEAMNNLLGIIERETELVRAGKIAEAMSLEAKKRIESQKYADVIATFKGSRDYLLKTIPDLLATLHRHHDVFRAMLQINLTVLATAHAVTEGIVRGVNGELQRRNMPQGYTAGGQRAAPNPRTATPLSVSRSL
jgi:hypothetical protein